MRAFDIEHSPLPERRTVLEASAGTGKTYTLAGLFVRHLLAGARPGGRVQEARQILVVTFTRASTQDLMIRLRAALQDALAAFQGDPAAAVEPLWRTLAAAHGPAGIPVLERALREFDLVTISTIHGFCQRVLDRAAFAGGTEFVTEFVENDSALVLAACADALRSCVQTDDPLPAAIVRHAGLDPAGLQKFFEHWQRFPDTTLAPQLELGPALAALRTALAAATAAFDADAVTEALVVHKSLGAAPWANGEADYCRRLGDLLRLAPGSALELLGSLSLDNLTGEYCRKRPQPSVVPTAASPAYPFFVAAREVTRTLEPARIALTTALLHDAFAALQRAKEAARTRSFHDLLVQLHGLVRDPATGPDLCAAVQKEWRLALVDECQDTDPLQYAIFDALFGEQLVLVGDPKQSIYSFRGADLDTYLQAAQRSEQFTLDTNFRSHPDLVTGVIRLFQRAKGMAFVEPRIQIPEVRAHHAARDRELDGRPGTALEWRLLPVPAKDGVPKKGGKRTPSLQYRSAWEPTVLADLVAQCRSFLLPPVRLSDTGAELQRRDLAILVRSSDHARTVQAALAEAGIPASIARTNDVFASDEAADLEVLMHAVLEPSSPHVQQAARATRLWGCTARQLVELADDAARMQADLALLQELQTTWQRRGVMAMFTQAADRLQLRGRMLARADGERKLTNWFQTAELLQQEATRHHLGPAQLLGWFAGERGSEDRPGQDRELRLESDAEAVQILTVHSSKGLQFEVVLLPYVTNRGKNGDKHDPGIPRRDGPRRILDLTEPPSAEATAAADRDRLAEDLRLLYVALTRAKRRCLVWHAPDRDAHQTALAWLLHFHHAGNAGAPWTPDWSAQTKERALEWDQDLDDFVREHAAAMTLVRVPLQEEESPRNSPEPRAAEGPMPTFLPIPAQLTGGDKTASFSRLLRGASHDAPADHDDDRAEAADPGAAPPQSMFGFARGASAGTCLHAILEHADFRAAGSADNRRLIRELLEGHGFLSPEAHDGVADPVALVQQMLAHLTQSRCAPLGFALAELAPEDRNDEWSFLLGTERVDVPEIGRILAASDQPDFAALGRTLAAQTGADPRYRHLVGKVDLMCRHQGRWYVFDWKSNHLGNRTEDYAAERLAQSMCSERYVLQYHLYLAGLHCHLRTRCGAAYDYDRDIGGACYVYLRGIDESARTGWFFDKPPRRVIEALADALWTAGGAR